MRKIIFLFVFCFLPFSVWAEDEIVIEMHGAPTAESPSIWQKTARQLSRKLRNSTREQLLYAMPVVSDKDRIVRSPSAEYALVEYYNNRQFRKFLFKAEEPQSFITVAATAADVLAINKKYNINIGLKLKDFLSFYGSNALQEKEPSLKGNTVLYKLSYQDINTPTPTQRWFLFEKEELTLTFETEESKTDYLTSLRKKTEEKQKLPVSLPPQKQKRTVRKALVSGGTLQDQMYMPRVIHPKTVPPTMTLNKENKKSE